MMRCLLPILCVLLLIAVAAAEGAPVGEQDLKTPKIKGVLDSSRTAVFESPQQSCDNDDIPDAMARAFRDSTGTIHLVAASSKLFQNLGSTLENVQHSCEVGHYSANDPNPADFNDQTWIDSFYTLDGNTIAGLTHTEYHGWAHPGECHSQNYSECEYDSDTYHQSQGWRLLLRFVQGAGEFFGRSPLQV